MRLVVGLGNPGERYADTRHNVAWHVLDRLASRWDATAAPGCEVFSTRMARTPAGPVELMRPLSYMNRSGEALERWVQERGGLPEDLLVVMDDVWLPVGTLRLRARGSSGGHRGLESVEAALATRDFARLRIGVGAAGSPEGLRDHVLEPFGADELPQVEEAIGRAADAVECWATEGIGNAMNRFNRGVSKEVEEP